MLAAAAPGYAPPRTERNEKDLQENKDILSKCFILFLKECEHNYVTNLSSGTGPCGRVREFSQRFRPHETIALGNWTLTDQNLVLAVPERICILCPWWTRTRSVKVQGPRDVSHIQL